MISELCKKYEISPAQVHRWKKHFLEQGAELFNKKEKTNKAEKEQEESQRVFYEKIGALTVERDFLKKV